MSVRRVAGLLLALALAEAVTLAAHAADLGIVREATDAGVDCESPAAQTFPSVWLGHFSGGFSHRLAAGLPVVLDWRDEKLCFPSRASCDGYMRVMRREFHRPEGYFTCLPIR